jgi:glycosyltransferase involved in cell wall biosynthesis
MTLPTIWFEVEDLLRHFRYAATVTGIQRVCQEVLAEAERLFGASGRVRFCRLSFTSGLLEEIPWRTVKAAFEAPLGRFGPATVLARGRLTAVDWLRVLPSLVRWVAGIATPVVRDVLTGRAGQRRFAEQARQGDVIVALGGPWINPGYGARIAAVKQATGARFGLLIHDVIPLVDPAAFTSVTTANFVDWLHDIVGRTDLLFAVSDSSRRDLQTHAARVGWSLPSIEVLRLGAGFRARETASDGRVRSMPERYVLFVSTIEIRKNHLFLLRIWRRLIERHGASSIPALVCVGRIGWKVDDFLAELAATDGLGDGDVIEAYRHCLFTVYPSRHEGWGLPVAESLKHGKFCVSSNSSSLPEVGGDLVDYFDPADEDGAFARIERVLFEPGYLAAREAHIRMNYRPPSWADCARDLVDAIDRRTPS